jgi:hypothetical protein
MIPERRQEAPTGNHIGRGLSPPLLHPRAPILTKKGQRAGKGGGSRRQTTSSLLYPQWDHKHYQCWKGAQCLMESEFEVKIAK